MASPKFPSSGSLLSRAFSLVEMLMVVAIIGIVLGVAIPAFHAISAANNLTNAVNGLAGAAERARAYAMANNQYVYLGIAEVNADVSAAAVPQIAATETSGGRLAIVAVASRDGTRGYTLLSSLANPAWADYNNGSGLISISNVEVFENVHLAASLDASSGSASMARPIVAAGYRLGDPTCKSVTPFAWPLKTPLTPDVAQYYFEKVIQFDPQGAARIQYSTNQDNIVPWIEIALQQTHGSAIPAGSAQSTGAVAAIMVDGMTGAVRIYRP